MSKDFEVIGTIDEIQTIATGNGIREIARLRKAFGAGRWRKLKGTAYVRFEDVQSIASSCTGTKRMALAARN